VGRKAFFEVLSGQVRERDSALEAARSPARAVLAAGSVLLGITVISLGNPALYILGMRRDGAGPDGLPWLAPALITACFAAGLGLIMASVALSVRALAIPYVRYATSRGDFFTGGGVDMDAVERAAGSPDDDMHDDDMHDDLIVSCARAIGYRERVLPRVGARTFMAQRFLLAGVLLIGGDVMAALPLLLAAALPWRRAGAGAALRFCHLSRRDPIEGQAFADRTIMRGTPGASRRRRASARFRRPAVPRVGLPCLPCLPCAAGLRAWAAPPFSFFGCLAACNREPAPCAKTRAAAPRQCGMAGEGGDARRSSCLTRLR